MKRFTTLLLLLICSTAFVQDVEQDHWHMQQMLDTFEEPEASETPATLIADLFESWKAGVTWPPFSSGSVVIPEPQPDINPPSEPQYVWHSLWDSWNYDGDKFNTVKVFEPSKARDVLSRGKNAIVSLSHRMVNIDSDRFTQEEKQKWRSILRGRSQQIQKLNPQRTIVFLWDEPMIGGARKRFTREELEWMVATAKEEIGSDYSFGFSFTRNTMLHRELPQNIDFVLLPMYLFFDSDYPDIQVWNRQEFDEYFDFMMVNAREKLPPGVDIFVIAQGFYSLKEKKWRKPPAEAPEWYIQAVWRNNLQGIVWWLYEGNDGYAGMKEMPDYFEAVRRADARIPEQ